MYEPNKETCSKKLEYGSAKGIKQEIAKNHIQIKMGFIPILEEHFECDEHLLIMGWSSSYDGHLM